MIENMGRMGKREHYLYCQSERRRRQDRYRRESGGDPATEYGARVLLIDADHQGNASKFYRIPAEPEQPRGPV